MRKLPRQRKAEHGDRQKRPMPPIDLRCSVEKERKKGEEEGGEGGGEEERTKARQVIYRGGSI